MSWSPQDFPFLVQKQANVVNTLSMSATMMSAWGQLTESGAEGYYSGNTRVLDSAPQTWLDSEVCELLQGTYDDVPAWSPEACIPSPDGIIAFEKTIHLQVENRGQRYGMPIDGFVWGTDGGRVKFQAMCRQYYPILSEIFGAVFSYQFQVMNNPLILWPCGSIPASATVAGSDTPEEYLHEVSPSGEESEFYRVTEGEVGILQPFVSLVGATWLLLSQPAIVEEPSTEQVTMRVRQPPRKRAKGAPKKLAVRVSVRTLSGARVPKSHRGQRGKATTRWWVRGHWRQQAWGKNRALRRPVYIAPHTAGARDVAVDERPQIQVVRKD